MLIKIDKFDGGVSEFKEFSKRQWVLEVTEKQPPGRVRVGANLFANAEEFNAWAQALTQQEFDALAGQFIEFLDAGDVSLE